MLNALNSISSRPVGALAPASTSARNSSGQTGSAFPGLGEYGRPAQGKATLRLATKNLEQAGKNREKAETACENTESDSLNLSPEAQAQLLQLKQRDAEVRTHEKSHMAAGGPYVSGGPSYDYQKGPDGRQYAIGGHVSIDASSIPDDPEKAEDKARQVKRAALAPGEPSAQDRTVAARASAEETQARREQQEEKTAAASNRENAKNTASPKDSSTPFQTDETSAPGGLRQALLRAAESYAAMAQRGVMPTALAPGGTGISLQI